MDVTPSVSQHGMVSGETVHTGTPPGRKYFRTESM